MLELRTTFGAYRVVAVVVRSHLTRTLVDGVLARVSGRYAQGEWILIALHVGRNLGAYLAEQGVNYIDPAGNCRLHLGTDLFALVQGRAPDRPVSAGRAMGLAGHRVLFGLLVKPDLLAQPVRAIAAATQASAATTGNTLKRLEEEGLIHEGSTGRRVTSPDTLLDKWLHGYETVVRPKLLIGRFRTPETSPFELEQRIASVLDGEYEPWALGGTAAAYRLTGHYRGDATTVHLGTTSKELLRGLKAIPATDGPLVLLGVPSDLAFDGASDRTVAPLLVYSELLHAGDRRSRESAAEVRTRYLTEA